MAYLRTKEFTIDVFMNILIYRGFVLDEACHREVVPLCLILFKPHCCISPYRLAITGIFHAFYSSPGTL
jgi:hypothetical protein